MIAIIGGGIVGSSIAYHLTERADHPVHLFERGSAGSETTERSVAQFGFYGNAAQYAMKQYGLDLYNELFRGAKFDPAYQFAGHLTITEETKTRQQFSQAVEDGGKGELGSLGSGFERDAVEFLPGEAITKKVFVPPLDTSMVRGALFRPNVGYFLRPRTLVRELLDRAEERGLTLHTRTEITDISATNGRVDSISTAEETLEVDTVVCAAGPWNPTVAEMVDLEIPVRHTLAPVIQLSVDGLAEYGMPVVNHYDSSFSFHRRSPDEFLISHYPGGYDSATRYSPEDVPDSVPSSIRSEALSLVEGLFPTLDDASVVDEWVGVRSATPDGNPIVGRTSVDGFYIAAFHTSGIQLAPAVGRNISEQILDDERSAFYDDISITRFEGYHDLF